MNNIKRMVRARVTGIAFGRTGAPEIWLIERGARESQHLNSKRKAQFESVS